MTVTVFVCVLASVFAGFFALFVKIACAVAESVFDYGCSSLEAIDFLAIAGTLAPLFAIAAILRAAAVYCY